MSTWVEIYTTTSSFEAFAIQGALTEYGIKCIVFNMQDTAYGFGDIAIKVKQEDVVLAMTHIAKLNSNTH
ncbi:MAG: putative prokaryotic signal transducing protein [Bacteroidota bacterium]|jgi:hypothetical protein